MVIYSTGFDLIFTPFHLVLNQDLQDFEDYSVRLRFGGKGYLKMITFHPTFRRCETQRRKAWKWIHHLIIILPMPSNDVIVNPVNPVNPDSKPLAAAHILSTDDWVSGCPMYFWRDGFF